MTLTVNKNNGARRKDFPCVEALHRRSTVDQAIQESSSSEADASTPKHRFVPGPDSHSGFCWTLRIM
jgi:hypothetical protein